MLVEVPNWQPIRRKTTSNTTDPHFAGLVTVELAPDGIRWWWIGREAEEPDGRLSIESLVTNCFITDEAEIEEAIRYAREHLERARVGVAKADRQLSFKVVT